MLIFRNFISSTISEYHEQNNRIEVNYELVISLTWTTFLNAIYQIQTHVPPIPSARKTEMLSLIVYVLQSLNFDEILIGKISNIQYFSSRILLFLWKVNLTFLLIYLWLY